ncbi:MAG: type II/IV secretion system ATPase subunit [Candidatus Micrarchaeota archaeon]|nr:type II/IV secretion system ATPase subunit [Candidatus Micrarchaeota archaeon]
MIKTVVDEICIILENSKGNKATTAQIAKGLNLKEGEVEAIAKSMQDNGVIEITYPVDIISKPVVRLLAPISSNRRQTVRGKAIEEYEIKAHLVSGDVSIVDSPEHSRPVYNLDMPSVGPYTEIFLEHIRNELAHAVPIVAADITDPRKAEGVRDRFQSAASELLRKQIPGIGDGEVKIVAGMLLHSMYGLGELEILMSDDNLEEIAINGSTEPLSVYHKKLGWLKTNLFMKSEDEIYNYASQIGRKSGRDITLLTPILDAYLDTGDRVNATLFPISSCGNTITIRRFARDPWTVIDFLSPKVHTLSSEIAAFLWQCVQYEMNILVVGGTASGKTSTLNTLCAMIPPANRIVTIEDTRELALPSYLKWNWIPLTTRNANPEGKGAVRMLDLMVNALRMRPDRIIVGEVRKRREAEVLFEAMHTGHAVYSTLHADNGQQVIRRLTHPPFEIPTAEMQSLHLLLVQYRDRRSGMRRTYELSEMITSSVEMVSLNPLYRWKARTDEFEKVGESMRIFEELNIHTGMSMDELKADIGDKKLILEWMLRRGIRSVDEVGQVMGLYYKEPDTVLQAAKKDKKLNRTVK